MRKRIVIEALDGALMLVSLEYRVGLDDWLKEHASVSARQDILYRGGLHK